jgi:hypothetical protein
MFFTRSKVAFGSSVKLKNFHFAGTDVMAIHVSMVILVSLI